MDIVSFLAFMGMVAIVTWAFLRYIRERDLERQNDREINCPKHGHPWLAPDDDGIWYCGYWDEEHGADHNYGCPQVNE